ncbi:MAG: D-amino-acid transaminase [Thiotrichales bacterium]|nr:D-amino-acid transaminase [Thiotrichales bacterium]
MTRIVYVDGQFVPENEARVSVFDRGFLFGDGVYEVSAVLGGGLVDNAGHLARLERSLGELGIVSPATPDEIARAQKELVARNDLGEGIVYLQITRGPADRDFAYPAEPKPTLVMFTQKKALVDSPLAARGITVITVPELRWRRRDVKTVGLLAASMAKQAALDAGADDAWMVEDGFVTEGSSNNAYIVTRSGVVVTRHLGNEILHGITRATVLRLARERQITIEERPFTVEEAKSAAEAFITSASSFVIPVVGIDGETIGDGRPGPITGRLRDIYIESARASADS